MSFISGTITSSNPSADLYTALATPLAAAGFTLVDTVVISTRTHKIWKSAAASNVAGKDWYLDVVYFTTGGGSLYMFPMEFYDPATDSATRMVFTGVNSTVVDATTYSRYGATAATLENANWVVNASTNTVIALTTSTSSFGYWITVTANRVIGMSSVSPTLMLYSGLYTPTSWHAAFVGADAFPLIVARLSANGSASGGTSTGTATAALTRVPRITSMNSGINDWGNLPQVHMLWTNGSTQLAIPRLPDGAITVSGSYLITPLAVDSAQFTSSQGTNALSPIGTLIDIGVTVGSTSVARGDTVTVGADTWVLSTNSGATTDFLLAMRAI